MTPPSKRSRTRRARATNQLEPLPARVFTYGDLLPPELWREAFAYCLPLTLLAARDTCRLFRRIIDRNDSALLARAPLLLPNPPPDPRWYMQRTRNEHVRQTIGAIFGITDPWSDFYGSAAYTKMLYLPGRCHVTSNHRRVSIASHLHLPYQRRCRLNLFRSRTRKVVKLARKNWLPKPSLPMDRYLIPWVPTMSMVKGRKTIAVPACDLIRAREEYESKVLASASTTERRRGRKALFAQYKFRCRQKRMLEILEGLIEYWKKENDSKVKQCLKINKARLREFANERQIPLSQAFGNPDVQRALDAHSKVFALISPSILSDAGLFNPMSNRAPCEHCHALIAKHRLECHIASSHPEQFLYARQSAKTVNAEYRCALCPMPSLRWFSAFALQAHQYDKPVRTF
ncbi:hypothetical protein K525DRAFT_289493 [Schizophyllum commune Loenen D]|nr:hypothetical protein K525DRAFT_289493 [Schizophyllum commune Loenen D]